MKIITLVAAAAFAALSVAPALAADVVSAKDPQGVLNTLDKLGYQASLSTDTDGISTIEITIDGSKSYIDFWGCNDKHTDCRTLMLYYGMNLTDGTTAEKANEWNSETIHGFVYLNDENDPWLNLAVLTGDGIPAEVFADLMLMWRSRTSDVREFFDF